MHIQSAQPSARERRAVRDDLIDVVQELGFTSAEAKICIALRAGVICASGEVYPSENRFPHCAQCDGLSCDKPLECDTTRGKCEDLSCKACCPRRG